MPALQNRVCEMKRQRTLPWSATASIFTLSSFAMKPITEKMTKPANILVALLVHVTINVSLQRKHKKTITLFLIHRRGLDMFQMSLTCMHTFCGNTDKGKFYTYQVNMMLVGDSRSLHTTTRYQMFKFPSFTCHKGSHGLKKTQSISALGISEDSSNDNTVHNGVLYSIPKVVICSLRYIWTNHRCSGKIFFVLYFSTHNIQGKAFCTLQHLPICRGTALGDCCWDGNLKKSVSECHAIMVKST